MAEPPKAENRFQEGADGVQFLFSSGGAEVAKDFQQELVLLRIGKFGESFLVKLWMSHDDGGQ
jgi:hypothetical protein